MKSSIIPTIGLQFSIHESTDEARDKLIPFKEKLTLEEIAHQGILWHIATGRKPFINYCVHDDNNSQADVDRLLSLYAPKIWEATISVICERNEGMPAKNEYQLKLANDFSELMIEAGYNVRVFDPAGQDDIGGGCGQLWFVQDWAKNNKDKVKPSIGNDKEIIHTPC